MHYLFFQARNYTENTDFLYSFSVNLRNPVPKKQKASEF